MPYFFSLPVALIISNQANILFILYLVVIELLITLAILARMNNDLFSFKYDGYRIKVKDGLFKSTSNIICDKVNLVHAEKADKDIRIIIITKSRFRNKYLKSIDANFMKRYPYAGYHYARMKKIYPENNYCYLVFRNGGYKKYLFLNELFKQCVHADFTDEAIEQIKKSRET
ncbi:hypothetical protein [Clostridium sp. DMHC 10]|uniref:hypothetical protein n=1 Tax=Clostridium sp. DMHC 10 TaxID=747377 RepID=UPI000AEF4754|nr:hypothetical protein [Clostridium sp. DMHC 10]